MTTQTILKRGARLHATSPQPLRRASGKNTLTVTEITDAASAHGHNQIAQTQTQKTETIR